MGFLDNMRGGEEKRGAATYAATDSIAEGHLSEKEEKVLNIIAGSSWPMTARQVAKAVNIDPTVTAILIENLEKKYLVKQTNLS